MEAFRNLLKLCILLSDLGAWGLVKCCSILNSCHTQGKVSLVNFLPLLDRRISGTPCSSIFIVIVWGRQLHNQVSRYLCKSSPWYLSHLQLILVSLHLLPLAQGATAYMGLNVLYHLRPVVVSFDYGLGFPSTKMAKMIMHLLENSFDKGLWDDSGFIFLAILSVYVVQQTCVIIPIWIPFMQPTPRIFHQFGNSDAMFIRLLQSFCVSQFNLIQ